MLEEEQMYVCRHHLERYCRFVGIVDDVRPCLYAADAFVMTSQWEGLGIAALEAMSTALPAVLYNVPGLRDLLPDGKGGLIEPHADSLVEALLFLISHPESRKSRPRKRESSSSVPTHSKIPLISLLIFMPQVTASNREETHKSELIAGGVCGYAVVACPPTGARRC